LRLNEMVSIVIPDDKLLALCAAIFDEPLRETIFALQGGPMTSEVLAQAMGIGDDDARGRINRLLAGGLLRRVPSKSGPDLYALDFSIGRLGEGSALSPPLAAEISRNMSAYLESHSEEIGALCESDGSTLGRAVEQIFLGAFSSVITDLQRELADEDKRLSALMDKR